MLMAMSALSVGLDYTHNKDRQILEKRGQESYSLIILLIVFIKGDAAL